MLLQGVLIARVQLKNVFSVLQVWHRYQHPPFKPSQRRYIQLPRHVRRRKDANTFRYPLYLVHLPQELCFNPPFRFTLITCPSPPQTVHLIDQNYARRMLPGQFEEQNQPLFRLSDIL